jgi:hypothetical protein
MPRPLSAVPHLAGVGNARHARTWLATRRASSCSANITSSQCQLPHLSACVCNCSSTFATSRHRRALQQPTGNICYRFRALTAGPRSSARHKMHVVTCMCQKSGTSRLNTQPKQAVRPLSRLLALNFPSNCSSDSRRSMAGMLSSCRTAALLVLEPPGPAARDTCMAPPPAASQIRQIDSVQVTKQSKLD